MITALHIRANKELELFEYDPCSADSLEALQSRVGGWIEAAPIYDRRMTMYCNEEGKLLGLPPNWLASFLLDPRAEDVIAGDVVIVGAPDEEGYDTTIPDVEILRGGRSDSI